MQQGDRGGEHSVRTDDAVPTAATTPAPLPRLLGSRQLFEILGAGRSWKAFQQHVRRLARRGELVPIREAQNSLAWLEDEVRRYIDSRPRTRRLDKEGTDAQ